MLRTFMYLGSMMIPAVVFFLCAVNVLAQDEVRLFDAITRGNAAPGYYLMAPTNNEKFGLVDHGGWVMQRRAVRGALNLQRHPDGTYTYFVTGVGIVRMDEALQPIDTVRASNEGTDFHECKVLANGNYLILSISPRIVDLSGVVQGGSASSKLLDAVIEEIEPDGDVVWTWNSKDHSSVLDATRGVDLTAAAIDYIHVNSFFVDADGNVVISMRNFDEVAKINKTSGNFMWRLGGQESKNNQFTWLNDTTDGFRGFSRQHSAVRSAPGRLLLLDNGNLKPTEYSRAVEYEVNEANRTVRRVWQYRPTPDVFARTMGSVERFANGGTLIGWGQNLSRMALTELDSSGTVVYELRNAPGVNVSSYRVGKYPVRMSASRKTASQPGIVNFASDDSTTNVSIDLDVVGGTRRITVERHSYGALGSKHDGEQPIETDPVRWTIRADFTSTDSGSVAFAVADVKSIRDPRLAFLWHRPLDGDGAFKRLASTYNASSGSIIIPSLLTGEFAVGYDVGIVPIPIHPDSGAIRVSRPVDVRWRGAIRADAYEVQFSRTAAFSTIDSSFTTTATATRVDGLRPSQTYFWRVRARIDTVFGPWSTTFMFRTRLEAPVLTTPRTVVAPEVIRCSWRPAIGATGYILRVTADSLLLMRSLGDTSAMLNGLPGDKHLQWTVTSLNDIDTSTPSEAIDFSTLPHIPTGLSPSSGTTELSELGIVLAWTRRSGTASHVRVVLESTGQIVVDDTISADRMTIPALQSSSLYRWSVRSIGAFGPSAWSTKAWFATKTSLSLNAAALVSPSDGATVDGPAVPLQWESVNGARRYYIQVSDDRSYLRSIVDTMVIDTTEVSVAGLPTDRQLFWRVFGANNNDLGQWSEVRSFTITGSGLGPISPEFGATNVPVDGTVTYTTSAAYSSYVVEFGLDTTNFVADKIYPSTTGRCFYLGLDAGTWFWWRVTGIKPDGTRIAGAFSRFQTSPTLHVALESDGPKVTYIHGVVEVNISVLPDDRCVLIDLSGREIEITHVETAGDIALLHIPSGTAPGVYVVVIQRHERVLYSVPMILLP